MAKKLKEIGFNYSHGEERTETIDVDGYKPFDITFTVPDAQGSISAALSVERGDDEGEVIINRLFGLLKGWTLKEKLTKESLLSIADVNIHFVMLQKIVESGAQVKN